MHSVSPPRKASRTQSERNRFLPSLPTRPTRPGLAVDTSVSRYRGQEPLQVFPYETKTQEISFVSFADLKALEEGGSNLSGKNTRTDGNHRSGLQQRLGLGKATRLAESLQQAQVAGANEETRDGTAEQQQAIHQRVKGLRPKPLTLKTDVSPSDRAIPIGIAVSSIPQSTQLHTQDLEVSATTQPPVQRHYGQEVATPTIIITPAKEDFDCSLGQSASSRPVKEHESSYRPCSSVYSSYTNYLLGSERTPAVPSLPTYGPRVTNTARNSTDTLFEEHTSTPHPPRQRKNKDLSIRTFFEQAASNRSQNDKRLTSQSHLPTPQRSRGWWNVITSPFSASSASRAFFVRSPSLPGSHEDEAVRMLDEASRMGESNTHAGLIFSDRAPDDEGLRSAPPIDTKSEVLSDGVPKPRRSGTAPGALVSEGVDSVNIYRVPSNGEAARYYNPNNRFSSVMLVPDRVTNVATNRELDGWSPSQSVFREPRAVSVPPQGQEITMEEEQGDVRALSNKKSPFSDNHVSHVFDGFSGTHPAANAERRFFTSPSEGEHVESPEGQDGPVTPLRCEEAQPPQSHFSPLSATPTIEHARVATFMGPREVDVGTTPNQTQQASGEEQKRAEPERVRMASRGMSEKSAFVHARNDSHGLGIETPGNDGEKTLFPPPRPTTDSDTSSSGSYARLPARNVNSKDQQPWYRRFAWLLIATGLSLVILLIVLLTLVISPKQDDIPVQAQWLNLTGFPALPTGVATVAHPRQADDVDGCVNPAELWSCSYPGGGNGVDVTPNFRFEILFRNHTASGVNATALDISNNTVTTRSTGLVARAGNLARRSLWTNPLFVPSPAPPSKNDQLFLGRTTDNISQPYDGEETPFYISLLNASALVQSQVLTRRIVKRDSSTFHYPYPSSPATIPLSQPTSSASATLTGNSSARTTTLSSTFTSTAAKIPSAVLQPNGQPAPADLYPFVSSQPLRLYNRGQTTEHYGFYTYFDRSIYVNIGNSSSNSSITHSTSSTFANMTTNLPLNSANAVCTFSQTRLLVQIWTRRPLVTSLPTNTTTSTSSTSPPPINSTANDLSSPGSFPYSVTITLDRHGGTAAVEKGVYCYGLLSAEEGYRVDERVKTWIPEDRAWGGTIVDPAVVPGGNDTAVGGLQARSESTDGGSGIDGGTGGCKCAWQNWG